MQAGHQNIPPMFTHLHQLIRPEWLHLLVALSVLMFIGSLIAIPWLIIRLPEDYFVGETRHLSKTRVYHPLVYLLIRITKNIFGAVFLLMGIAMLVLPGQGILTMLIGLSMMDFPGKYRFERFLISRRSITRAINWIRHKAKRPPLLFDHE